MLLTGGAPLLSLGVGTTGCGGDPPEGGKHQMFYQVTSVLCIKTTYSSFLVVLTKCSKRIISIYPPEEETLFLLHLLSTQKTWAEVWQEQAGLPSETQVKTEPQAWGRLESRVSLVQCLLLDIKKGPWVIHLILLANYSLKPILACYSYMQTVRNMYTNNCNFKSFLFDPKYKIPAYTDNV